MRTVDRPSGLAAEIEQIVERATGGASPVRVRVWDGSAAGPADAPTVTLHSPDALRRIVRHPGELGIVQAYVTGELDVDGDLADALRTIRSGDGRDDSRRPTLRSLLAAAPAALALAARSKALGVPPPPPDSQARLRGRLHSVGRDRAAIAHHYDLSNDFYSLLLDDRLVYSCAYWTSDHPDYGLADAQTDKLDLVCRKLRLGEGDRLLDVGCGWGATAIHAAMRTGASVVGITLSNRQAEFARRRVQEMGLADRVTIRVQDYRELEDEPGSFDAVSSLEMGEHVGEHNYGRYAQVLHDAVKPGGRVLVQQMSRGHLAPGGGAFIEAFIAPDMHMRPVGATVDLLEGAGLELVAVQAMREHYVRTIEAWRDTFEERWDEAVALVGEETARVWRLYLVGSALAFEQGRMGVDQILTVRPS